MVLQRARFGARTASSSTDGVVEGFARRRIPYNRGFPLVRDANALDERCQGSGGSVHRRRRVAADRRARLEARVHRREEVHGVLLGPPKTSMPHGVLIKPLVAASPDPNGLSLVAGSVW